MKIIRVGVDFEKNISDAMRGKIGAYIALVTALLLTQLDETLPEISAGIIR